MFKALVSLGCGIVFGIGMVVSGMIDPLNIIHFLDVTGPWDPRLAFVMGGALLVFMPSYWLIIRKQKKPVMADTFSLPTMTTIDARLVIGAAIFGVGWGIGGICPGPALSSLSFGHIGMWVFFASMMVGLGSTQLILNWVVRRDETTQTA